MIRFLVALLAYDFNVLSAQNGRDGLRMALDRRPDLVISDVMMPEMDGFEMVRRLRQDPDGAKIPLIFLTARGSSDDRIQGHSDGADTYLAKPFRSEELLAAVDALLSRQQRIRESETTHNDEAMVFMASGMLEHLQRAVGSLLAVQDTIDAHAVPTGESMVRYHESVADLVAMVESLRDLTTVGSQPVIRPASIDDTLRSLAASASEHLPAGKSLHVELLASAQARITEAELAAIVRPLLDRAFAVTPLGRNIFLQTMHNRPLAVVTPIVGANSGGRASAPARTVSDHHPRRGTGADTQSDRAAVLPVPSARLRHPQRARARPSTAYRVDPRRVDRGRARARARQPHHRAPAGPRGVRDGRRGQPFGPSAGRQGQPFGPSAGGRGMSVNSSESSDVDFKRTDAVGVIALPAVSEGDAPPPPSPAPQATRATLAPDRRGSRVGGRSRSVWHGSSA